MPKKSDFSKMILEVLNADDTLFKGTTSRRRKVLLKQFATTLADVLEEYYNEPLDYDNLIGIAVKTAVRLDNLPNSDWDLSAQIKHYSTVAVYEKPNDVKNRYVDEKINEKARNIRAKKILSCWYLAEINPQAYMLLTDM